MNHYFNDIDDALADAKAQAGKLCHMHVRYNYDTESYHTVPHWVPLVDSDKVLYEVYYDGSVEEVFAED
jgi:hypothetical protein